MYKLKKIKETLTLSSFTLFFPFFLQSKPQSPSMTTYGTIPTSSGGGSASSSAFDYIHRAKARGASALASRRPWRELADPHSFGLPPSIGDAYLRLRANLIYFAMNYAIVVLLIVFLSLLWHPVSLIVFIVAMIGWLFFYFLKDEPSKIFGREIGDSIVLLTLGVVTLVLLLLTNATWNILVSLLVGFVVVAIHAAVRKNEEMSMDSEGGWYTPAGTGMS
ncbi:hypothetical protein LUZ60_009575 [Juncus effusus]|nr:hypothetical protein LUZ60_009575 [Juncus effusus]